MEERYPEVAQLAKELAICAEVIDCGGGLPVLGEWPIEFTGAREAFDLLSLRRELGAIKNHFPSAREIWMENGRFVLAHCGILVIKVLDVKERSDRRYLICDGGRTNHALVSDWDMHQWETYPPRSGQPVLTAVCGPTCMAFDRLMRTEMPKDIQRGDYIVWHNAGAYHLPWETRFSHGLATVLWLDEASYNHCSAIRNFLRILALVYIVELTILTKYVAANQKWREGRPNNCRDFCHRHWKCTWLYISDRDYAFRIDCWLERERMRAL